MCTSLWLNGAEVDDLNGLRAVVSDIVFIYPTQAPRDGENSCLCVVDMEATLSKAGLRFTETDIGDFEVQQP